MPVSSHSPVLCPPRPGTTVLLSVSVDVAVLHISHKWDHTVCGLLRLSFLSTVSSGSSTL